jgi:hypothetical protein
MSSSVATTMSPEDKIFTFKQKEEENFKEACLEFMIGMEKLNLK